MDADRRRFLITGAQGFLGRHVAHALLSSTPCTQILGVGRSPYTTEFFTHSLNWVGQSLRAPVPGYLRELTDPTRFTYQTLDLRDVVATAKLIREFSPQVVIHLASGLRGDPIDQLMRNGVEGTASLMEALGHLNKTDLTMVYASSGGVYGEVAENCLPVSEESPPNPADLYSISKLASEQVCRCLGAQYGIRVGCARVFNLVGPGQDERHVCGRFAAQVAAIMLGLQPPFLATGDLQTTRDFMDVRDCAAAIVLLATRAADQTYNLASGQEKAIASILQVLLRQSGLAERVTVSSSGSLPRGVRRSYACISRISGLQFRPQWTIDASLGDLLNYYLHDVAAAARASH